MNYQQAILAAKLAGEKVVPTVCGMCGPGGPGGGCGIYAFVKDGRFVKVAGMDESPVNRGAVCAKGHAAPQWVYSPERLTHPLRRIGKKGEGKFEKITWDNAIARIAETLQEQKAQYGPESLAMLTPAKRSYSDYIARFLVAHGSPNYGHSGICAVQRAFCFMYTIGDWPRQYSDSDLIIYWGRQPIYSGPVWQRNVPWLRGLSGCLPLWDSPIRTCRHYGKVRPLRGSARRGIRPALRGDMPRRCLILAGGKNQGESGAPEIDAGIDGIRGRMSVSNPCSAIGKERRDRGNSQLR